MYYDNTPQSPPPEVSSAHSSSGQEDGTEKNPSLALELPDQAAPRSAVALGHIPAAETALAKQIRADLDAELGLTPDGQIPAAPSPQKGGRQKKAVVPLPDADVEALLQKVCYDNSTRLFWKQNPEGTWLSLNQRDLVLHLMQDGMPDRSADGESLSQTDEFVVRAQNERCIDMRTTIGGYRTGVHQFGDIRILVPTEPKFLKPVPGDWSMLSGIFYNMFKDEQLPYIFGWIKVALDMFHQQSYMPGQVLVLCGEREAGKNLFARLLRELFGGRNPGKPYSFMTQGTDFNSDFIGKELLTIEDEVSHTTFTARQGFGAKIKDLSANEDQRLHRKGAEAVSVQPLQRLVISLNDEPECMQILPILAPDIVDKIMLIKMFRHPMPMPTSTAQQRKAFHDVLVEQLPAFLHFLEGWQIPSELVASRFGIKHFHHPDLVDALQQQSPEEHLLRLIDEELFPSGAASPTWAGVTNQLDRKLKDSSVASVAREASGLLKGNVQCGTYLARLANKYPKRIGRIAKSGGCQKWIIKPPAQGDEDSDEAVLSSASQPASKLKPSPELLKKIAEFRAKAQPESPDAKPVAENAVNLAEQHGGAVVQKAVSEEVIVSDSLPAEAGLVAEGGLATEGEGNPGSGVSGDCGGMEVACGAEGEALVV